MFTDVLFRPSGKPHVRDLTVHPPVQTPIGVLTVTACGARSCVVCDNAWLRRREEDRR